MQLLRAYQHAFDHPHWIRTLLSGSLCQAIPFVGPFVFLGYQFEIMESRLRDPDKDYPGFDFANFGHYLNRGAWPFLVWFVLSMTFVPVMYIGMNIVFVIVFLIFTSTNQQAMGPVISFAVGLCLMVFFAVLFVICLAIVPPSIRAGLTQDLSAGFQFSFARDFVKLVWREMAIQQLFFAISGLALVILGLATLGVGILPALALVQMAQGNLYFRLYQLYLQRGGVPVPLRTALPGRAN